MRSCCDVYPKRPFRWVDRPDGLRGRGEHSTVEWTRVSIPDGAIVYVPSLDVPAFLRRFATLPPSHRVTVVSGGEDVGMPRELFGEGQIRGSRRAMLVNMTLTLPQFVNDRRLLHWWVQNYDLRGCNVWTGCARALLRSRWLSRKVSPLPIGLDLHKFAERPPPSGGARDERGRRRRACEQQTELNAIRASLPAFADRPAALLAPFSCARADRRAACEALKRPIAPGAPPLATFFAGTRAEMWRAMGAHAFVAAPTGHGLDTHRAWEALALGSVPVVLSSSLDGLYAEYPVVVIQSWDDVTQAAIDGWRAHIRRQFGAEPFGARMRASLTGAHWAGRIATRHERDLAWRSWWAGGPRAPRRPAAMSESDIVPPWSPARNVSGAPTVNGGVG